MKRHQRLYAGQHLRKLRETHALRQADMAALLGISASYLSQLENDSRALTPLLADRVAAAFPLDWGDIAPEESEYLLAALREAANDPLFDNGADSTLLARLARQHPDFASRFVRLHEAYRRTGQRLEMVDDALSADSSGGPRLPWEEVRDWFHLANNYVDSLDRAAETLAITLRGKETSPPAEAIEDYLRQFLSVSIDYVTGRGLRDFDPQMRHLIVDPGQPVESRRFHLAHQLCGLALADDIGAIIEQSGLRSAAARQLLFVGLSNYAAGAVLMPYEDFRQAARSLRHDIDRLAQQFACSFEQTCHRLSTLQRQGQRGIPFFFCRVDMAGNITKRHSATRLQFARFGGACPLWIVHEAVAIPDRILVQLAETPDGVRYVSMAKGLVKPSGSFTRAPRRFAVAIGCEADHAGDFIYADGLDIASSGTATRIGLSCRICPRENCDQRAFPPSDRTISVNPDQRGIIPYGIR
ncbi:MAG: short-chain fatty acyl-CoA regulator family protein [Sphingomonadaceae bacterium]